MLVRYDFVLIPFFDLLPAACAFKNYRPCSSVPSKLRSCARAHSFHRQFARINSLRTDMLTRNNILGWQIEEICSWTCEKDAIFRTVN